ncbi:MAG TPA: hypothetical protein VHX88_16505 [Solirubrobacteraceae bacterium]|jgi:hypothetical protein|nr:hypothetical protein [Solirubrobacteraceae bacterium]
MVLAAICAFEAFFGALMIVLLIAGLVRVVRRPRAAAPQCPECDFPVRNDAAECPACGHSLRAAGELATAAH